MTDIPAATEAEPSAAFTPSVEWLLPIVETAIADFHEGAAGGGDTVSRFISKRVSHAIYAENALPFSTYCYGDGPRWEEGSSAPTPTLALILALLHALHAQAESPTRAPTP